MPRFTRKEGYYTYEPKNLPRRYILKKDEEGKWVAESYAINNGDVGELKMKHSDINKKRDASKIVEHWEELEAS